MKICAHTRLTSLSATASTTQRPDTEYHCVSEAFGDRNHVNRKSGKWGIAAMKDSDFYAAVEEKFPRLLDYYRGLEEGFIDAAEVIDAGVPDDTKSAIRLRQKVASRINGFPYFLGYRLGHELFSTYLTAGESGR